MKRFRLFGMLESCKKAMRTAGLAIERLETVLHSLLQKLQTEKCCRVISLRVDGLRWHRIKSASND